MRIIAFTCDVGALRECMGSSGGAKIPCLAAISAVLQRVLRKINRYLGVFNVVIVAVRPVRH